MIKIGGYYMDRINEGTYNTPNQFGDYTELINEYINKIFGQSLDLYLKRYASNNPTGTQKLDIDKIEESMGYIDDYLYYYYNFNSEKEFLSIFENLVVLNYLQMRELDYIFVMNWGIFKMQNG